MKVLCGSAVVVATMLMGSASFADQVASAPSLETLKTRLDSWLAPQIAAKPDLKQAIEELWPDGEPKLTPAQRSDLLLKALYLADPEVRELIESCRLGDSGLTARDFRALTSHRDDPLLANNVRAFYARFLATATLYEEALDTFREIDVAQVADPSTTLFYRAVCEHALLMKKEGLETLTKLLDETEGVPARYRALAELMKADLEKLEEKSLGEVAKQMSDVQRRLNLGRAGEKVQRVEDQIVVTLDEIIKKKEDEQNSSAGGGQASGRMKPNPSEAAPDSYNGGLKGQGLTDKKDIGHKDNWGNLPEKKQAAAKSMLDNTFPGHYRMAVEQYLKKIAERPAPTAP